MAAPSRCPICGYEGFDFTRSADGQWVCPECGEGFGKRPGGGNDTLVMAPGIALACVGGLTVLAALSWLVFNLVAVPMPAPPPNMAPAERNGFYFGYYSTTVGIPVFSILIGLIQLAGGIQMTRLRTRGFVIFASILSFVPCSCGILMGAPVAIWSLIVLNKPEVQRMFR